MSPTQSSSLIIFFAFAITCLIASSNRRGFGCVGDACRSGRNGARSITIHKTTEEKHGQYHSSQQTQRKNGSYCLGFARHQELLDSNAQTNYDDGPGNIIEQTSKQANKQTSKQANKQTSKQANKATKP